MIRLVPKTKKQADWEENAVEPENRAQKKRQERKRMSNRKEQEEQRKGIWKGIVFFLCVSFS